MPIFPASTARQYGRHCKFPEIKDTIDPRNPPHFLSGKNRYDAVGLSLACTQTFADERMSKFHVVSLARKSFSDNRARRSKPGHLHNVANSGFHLNKALLLMIREGHEH